MDTLTIRFSTKWPWNPTSPIIARLSGSKVWSHCFVIYGDMAYEATMMHGCRAVALSEAMQGVSQFQDMHVPVPYLGNALIFGNAQDGKPYDFAGAFGIPFLASSEWSDSSKWWCSELVFMMLYHGGAVMLDPDEQDRVTPNDLHQCNYPKSLVFNLRKKVTS